MRQVREELKNSLNIEKITNIPFDDIICHSEYPRKYFTIENNDIIYNRLINETQIIELPYLGPCVDFGLGDICLEEGENIFKFYTIDRAHKFDYKEFDNIEDAINHLVNFYIEVDGINNPNTMKSIFFDTLHLEEPKRTIKIKKRNKRKNI